MRLFFALVPEDASPIIAARNSLRRRCRGGSWTREDMLHLTIAFLGERPESEGPVLKALTRAIILSPITATCAGYGRFPRDTWVLRWRDEGPFRTLHGEVAAALDDAGIPYDRSRFTPHVTLARRAPATGAVALPSPFSVTFRRLVLFRSHQGTYLPLAEASFAHPAV